MPIEKSFRGVFNWKNSKFSPQIDSKPSCWAKVDFGQKNRFGVFDFFDIEPIELACQFWRQIDGHDLLTLHSEFRHQVSPYECARADFPKRFVGEITFVNKKYHVNRV